MCPGRPISLLEHCDRLPAAATHHLLGSTDLQYPRDLATADICRCYCDPFYSRDQVSLPGSCAYSTALRPASLLVMGSGNKDLDFSPSAFANKMQLRTRKARDFDKIEHDLPDPKSPALQRVNTSALASPINISGWLSRLANLSPFYKAVDGDDIIWLFDNTAYRNPDTGEWEAEFVAAVFEHEPKCRVADVVSSVAKTLGLAEDAEERDTIEERLLPFLWDIQAVRVFRVRHRRRDLRLGPTSVNGITTNTLEVDKNYKGSLIKSSAQVPRGVSGLLDMRTYYAGPEGWAILSGMPYVAGGFLQYHTNTLARYRRYHQGYHD